MVLALSGSRRWFGLAVLVLAGCAEPESGPATVDATPTPTAVRSGASIVAQHCQTCHGRGLYNAPLLTDRANWQPRLAAGDSALWQSVLTGKQAMPARGNCPDCSDEELRAALDAMLATVRATPAPEI